jgi:N-sulfoglucosamine sulfohydrolase
MSQLRVFAALLLVLVVSPFAAKAATPPNIVFIGSEDISPDLGSYGNKFVHTPNLDRLASEGARFTRCYTHAPVCAPSRSGMITGMYPISFGTMHMRSKLKVSPPPTFTSLLQKAGYHVSWPNKTDFNFDVPVDAFTDTKPWMNRGGPGALPKPFFAYINFTVTHESQIRAPKDQYEKNTARLKPSERVNPADVVLPPYYPDTPIVRHDVATYYENSTAMDYLVGDVLKALDEQGLAENTIVVFWGDHGWGMPRGKRWVYDSGTRCPLIVRWPGKVKPGTVRDDLVAVVDFAPTFLTMAGVEVPKSMAGQPYLTAEGEPTPTPHKYVFAARDRMDEKTDRIRAVRDARYRYVRNILPDQPYAQRVAYGEQTPTMQELRRLGAEGKLEGPQKLFMAATKPAEELYDVQEDPHEIHNLLDPAKPLSPELEKKLQELRAELDRWIADTHDMGAIPEKELVQRGIIEDYLATRKKEKAEKNQKAE